jgi:DNA-binding MarR family transcriptional regulator
MSTVLSDDALDRVSEGLANLGVALILPNGADLQARYANAIALVRDHGYSVQKAARALGISATHLSRKLNAIGAKGDPQAMADAGDRRILEMSQALSTLSGEELLERIKNDGDRMKTTELQKIYTASTNQVAVKQRWSQGSQTGVSDLGMSALAQILQGKKLIIEDKNPGDDVVDVVDVTPLG